jgi:Zn-dependent peptidase ImmA (M78 family)
MSRRDAEDAAAQLLRRHGVLRVPIPIEQLATLEGAQIVRQHFDGDQSGFVYRDGQRKIIGINSATNRRRQRFTIAHELGHIILHQQDPLKVDFGVQVNHRNEISSLAIDPLEIEANAFAAAVLMPEGSVLRYAREASAEKGISSRERLIARLAQVFDVSIEAMGYRLINLGLLSN